MLQRYLIIKIVNYLGYFYRNTPGYFDLLLRLKLVCREWYREVVPKIIYGKEVLILNDKDFIKYQEVIDKNQLHFRIELNGERSLENYKKYDNLRNNVYKYSIVTTDIIDIVYPSPILREIEYYPNYYNNPENPKRILSDDVSKNLSVFILNTSNWYQSNFQLYLSNYTTLFRKSENLNSFKIESNSDRASPSVVKDLCSITVFSELKSLILCNTVLTSDDVNQTLLKLIKLEELSFNEIVFSQNQPQSGFESIIENAIPNCHSLEYLNILDFTEDSIIPIESFVKCFNQTKTLKHVEITVFKVIFPEGVDKVYVENNTLEDISIAVDFEGIELRDIEDKIHFKGTSNLTHVIINFSQELSLQEVKDCHTQCGSLELREMMSIHSSKLLDLKLPKLEILYISCSYMFPHYILANEALLNLYKFILLNNTLKELDIKYSDFNIDAIVKILMIHKFSKITISAAYCSLEHLNHLVDTLCLPETQQLEYFVFSINSKDREKKSEYIQLLTRLITNNHTLKHIGWNAPQSNISQLPPLNDFEVALKSNPSLHTLKVKLKDKTLRKVLDRYLLRKRKRSINY
ncbi:CMP/dCMP deaminase [Tieghemostelium lacteum]|uniref:CMP/dCMP deaminase n=1 Tax=Tieghemostelium lacteum TaxID=361077 RepID=A0A152A671_TIELA|nr:CMP/dCMP deaminase [Tieghemostelium lacteum]|eukprot:KYR01720.1 CMP/dCMP deaminase [Tieghemostelium lacteum]